MTAQATRTRSTVVYFLQTHHKPAQVARLVQVITEGSPDAVVLVSHDVAGPALDVAGLQALGNVHVLLHEGGYGDFSHLDRYFAAVDWLDANGVDYDWLENLTGQDYPLRPIPEIEDALAATDYDGFLLYSPVFPDRVPASADQGAGPVTPRSGPFDATMRHDYRHWRFGRPTPAKQRWLRPLMAINFVQPWIRLSNSYASVGVRAAARCSARASTATAARSSARCAPSAPGTSGTMPGPTPMWSPFSVPPSHRRRRSCIRSSSTPAGSALTWTTSATSTGRATHTHPRTLGPADLDKMLASDAHWARKLDLDKDAKLFEFSTSGSGGRRVRRGSRTAI